MIAYELQPRHTLPRVVSMRAATAPDRVFVRHVDGPDLTYMQVDDRCRRWASVLRDSGVRQGDVVATMLFPSGESLCCWLGIAHAGGLDAGINTDFRGRLLVYVLNLSQAAIVVIDAALIPEYEAVAAELTHVHSVIVVGGEPPASRQVLHSAGRLLAGADPMVSDGPEQWDISCLVFTSGTTGPSKAVRVPWGQLYTFARLLFKIEDLTEDDVFFSPWPVYHTSGRFGSYMMALLGGTVVYRRGFSLSSWLDELRHFGVTTMILWPPMIDLLRDLPLGPSDATLPLRYVCAQWPPDHAALAARYGLEMRSCFGMTEVPTMIVPEGWAIEDHRAVGKVQAGWPGFEARLVDEHDQEVGVGEPGELIVRSSTPWTMNAGYFADPETTATAWRYGWFHTGDQLRMDERGNFTFIDRSTDSIRRRGENISSYEVEAYVLEEPAVMECAAVAAPVPALRDQEVKVVVVRVPGSTLTHAALVQRLSTRMPRFMVPRFVEFVDQLPRTASTMKVRKVELRTDVFNNQTWDANTGAMIDNVE